MKRMKTFFIYALLVIAFWIFSDIIIYLTINGTYKNKSTEVYISSPQVVISESKATYVNGYVKGSIKNNTTETLSDKCLKIDMYSPRDVLLGTKYVRIDALNPGKNQEFEMRYQFTDVNKVIITMTENIEGISDEEFLSQDFKIYWLAGKLLLLYFMA